MKPASEPIGSRHAVEVISHAELAAKLADGRPLRIKLG